MKRFLTLTVLALLAGCTDPTQPFARTANRDAMVTDDQIVLDLSRATKQAALEKYAIMAQHNPSDAVVGLTNELEKVSWLLVQHERNRARKLLVGLWIAQQEGVADLWYNDLKGAIKDTAPATEPAP